MLDLDTVRYNIERWIETIVEVPHPALGGWPPCPYAKKASYIINDVNRNLNAIKDPTARKKYLSSREKELKKEFTAPLTALSVYQGKVLMKLINRETQNSCYNIIKEYRGGFSARFWQTIAWVFGSSLKQDYDPKGEDADMEMIVLEVARMYGHAE
jgi:hypothetical protein